MPIDQFDEAIKLRNLYTAIRKCCKGSMWKDGTALYRWDGLENSVKLRKSFINGTYKLQRYQRFGITRPKPRTITATRIRDRHGQRSICDNILYQSITRSFIRNNGACQVDRGVDYEIDRVKAGLHRFYMRQRQACADAQGCRVEDIGPFVVEGAVYKGDVHRYFPSTLHRNAKAVLREHVKSPRLLAVLCAVVESFGEEWWCDQAKQAGASDKAAAAFARAVTEARTELEMLPLRPAEQRAAIAQKCEARIGRAVASLTELPTKERARLHRLAHADEVRGIALGSQVSQLLQLAQLDAIDHYATEVAHVDFYYRYMDDYVLIDRDPEKLKRAARDIADMLDALGLQVNPKSQLIPLRHGFIFLKWHLGLTPTGKVTMRAAQGVAKEEKRRLRRMVKKWREGKATRESIEQHYQGWRAHMARGDTERLLENMDNYLAKLLTGTNEMEGMT